MLIAFKDIAHLDAITKQSVISGESYMHDSHEFG